MTTNGSDEFDYRALGLISGIEIHQQLDTVCKLFCGCPTKLRDVTESDFEFFRYLRPARSELGEIDRAALEEVLVSRRFIYKSYDTTCLVEADEEPPSIINPEAMEVSLIIAKLLRMKIVDEVQTMRKTVIDGSNTSGFQRTAYIGSDGSIDTSCGPVGIGILCLEEEAARIIDDRGDELVYSLDRLGIPLVEIGTAPDIISPQHAREVASRLGMILRSTGRVKRGLGTIRQDVNVSIRGGARVEIKGVQDLNLIEEIVRREVMRQVRLLEIRDELIRRKASVDNHVRDVTETMAASGSRVITSSLKKGGVVLACLLKGFAGLVGCEVQPDRRLGTELSDRAKRAGVGGIFHTDELPAYGITEDDVRAVRSLLGASDQDCVVMVTGPRDRAEKALKGVLERACEAMAGVPEETRRALPDGSSEYMRPLPGRARMYPETDVPSVVIDEEMLSRLALPELFTERAARYEGEYKLSPEVARVMAASPNYQLFEEILRKHKIAPSLVVRALETTPIELAREGVTVTNLTDRHYLEIFSLLFENKIAKEGIADILRTLTERPELSALEAAKIAGVTTIDTSGVRAVMKNVVADKIDLVESKGERSKGPLMGIAMQQLRGKADGSIINSELTQEIIDALAKSTARILPEALKAVSTVSADQIKAISEMAKGFQGISNVSSDQIKAMSEIAKGFQGISTVSADQIKAISETAKCIQATSNVSADQIKAMSEIAKSVQAATKIHFDQLKALPEITKDVLKITPMSPDQYRALANASKIIHELSNASYMANEAYSMSVKLVGAPPRKNSKNEQGSTPTDETQS